MVDAIKLIRNLKKEYKSNITNVYFKESQIAESSCKTDCTNVSCNHVSNLENKNILIQREISFSNYEIKIEIYEDPSGTLAGGTGATLWDCSIAFCNYILYDNPHFFHNRKILELGAGCGLISIALNKILNIDCIATDRFIALELLTKNIILNNCSIDIKCLDWSNYSENEVLSYNADYFVGSDLIFPNNQDIWPNLIKLMKFLTSNEIIGFLIVETRNEDIEKKFFIGLQNNNMTIKNVLNSSLPNDISIYRIEKV